MATASPEPIFIKSNSRIPKKKRITVSQCPCLRSPRGNLVLSGVCTHLWTNLCGWERGPLLGQAWAICSALSGEEGKESRSAIFKYLEMCSPSGSGDSLTKAEGQSNQCPPRECYFPHIHHAQSLIVANSQKRSPWQDPCDYAASPRSVDRIITLYQRVSNFLSSSKQKLPVAEVKHLCTFLSPTVVAFSKKKNNFLFTSHHIFKVLCYFMECICTKYTITYYY